MGFFDFKPVDVPIAPIEFVCDSDFLTVPKSWESKVGKETLGLLQELMQRKFLTGRKWKDGDWNHKKFPDFTWGWLSALVGAAIKDTIELESLSIRFRNPEHKYTLKEFLLQDWKDKAHPWSPFLCAVFGTAPAGKVPVPPGKHSAKLLGAKATVLVDCDDTISDSIYED